ncbi:MAG: methyltransferase domain-containing protein [Chloroflexi bacterium]|nr:methyltransferase domain-containing protein [Chloroflexota bacterium]
MDAAAPPRPGTAAWRPRFVRCNLCGADACREIYPSRLTNASERDIHEIFACTSNAYGECGPIVRCTACGLVYQNPQPDPEDILAAYVQVVDARYEEEREGRVHTFRRALVELEEYAAPGRLLDVGSHLGVFVEVARERGWEAHGVEPSLWATERARARGLPVTCGTVADLAAGGEPHDVITLWDVIEHLSDPSGELRRLYRLLRPGGVLALSTMDVDAPVARLLGRNWPWYMLMHLFYFSRDTIRRLVESAGYEVIEVRRHRRIVRFSYLISRLERRIGRLYQPLDWAVERTGLGRRLVTVDLGDVITLFARRPGSWIELDASRALGTVSQDGTSRRPVAVARKAS